MDVSAVLRQWYSLNKRDLPWRDTRDPYVIWLSEIILQQTRVDQGLPYFQRFIKKYPSVSRLAAAPSQEVLKLWQGLGYYSRARNLHNAARQVVSDFGGKFPVSYDKLLSLKGVGEYTAAAVASFSSGKRVAVLDGNVFRFLSRYFGIDTPINSTEGKKVFSKMASGILPRKDVATHNQAIMEFGALQCRPVSPDCTACPLQDTCSASRSGSVSELPVKKRKGVVRERYFNYLVIETNKMVLLVKRTSKDIWQDMYEFPLIETAEAISLSKLTRSAGWKRIAGTGSVIMECTEPGAHKLSHQTIYARFVRVRVGKGIQLPANDLIQVPFRRIHEFPVPRLIEKYIEKQGHW